MTKFMAVVFIFSFILVGIAEGAKLESVPRAIPDGAQLDKYPLHDGSLSVYEQAELGLRPMYLVQDWTGYNFNKRREVFELTTLARGTLILATADSIPRYKEDCGNRLVVIAAPANDTLAANIVNTNIGGGGFWKSLWNILKTLWKILVWVVAMLLSTLFVIILVGLLVMLLFTIGNWISGLWGNGRGRREEVTTPPVRPVAPTPIMPVTPIIPTPTPVVPGISETTADSGMIRRFVSVIMPSGGKEPARIKFGGLKRMDVSEEGGVYTINAYPS